MKKYLIIICSVLSACAPYGDKFRDPSSNEPRYSMNIFSFGNELSPSEYARSLPDKELTVVFDVDDTVLLSSPGFQWGIDRYGKEIVSLSCEIERSSLSNRDEKSFDEFWEKMNTEINGYSLVRPEAESLIKAHKNRGDTIIFVTDRFKSDSEELTEFLEGQFSIRLSKPVIFTECGGMRRVLRKVKADIVYSDSDEDLSEAKEAGATPVRIPRMEISLNKNAEEIGSLGEVVIK